MKNGYDIINFNKFYIHPNYSFLSCTIDGMLILDNKEVAVVEIKTFNTCPFKKKILLKNYQKKIYLNENSDIYYQV